MSDEQLDRIEANTCEILELLRVKKEEEKPKKKAWEDFL